MSRSSSREPMVDALRQANDEIVSLKAMLETFVTKLDATTSKVRNVEAMLTTRREEDRKSARSEEKTVASAAATSKKKKKTRAGSPDGESRPDASDRGAASPRDESDRSKQMRLTRDKFPLVQNWMVDVGAVKLGDSEHNMLEEEKEEDPEREEVLHPKEQDPLPPPPSAPRSETAASPKKIEYIAW